MAEASAKARVERERATGRVFGLVDRVAERPARDRHPPVEAPELGQAERSRPRFRARPLPCRTSAPLLHAARPRPRGPPRGRTRPEFPAGREAVAKRKGFAGRRSRPRQNRLRRMRLNRTCCWLHQSRTCIHERRRGPMLSRGLPGLGTCRLVRGTRLRGDIGPVKCVRLHRNRERLPALRARSSNARS